jgi:serine/threonine-protein kinase
MIGRTISQYNILEKLGEGGMGVVYKAQDTKLDRFVALKFLPPHLAASEQDKARFIQEAKSAAALNHPNVCSIIDIQEVDGQMFIVMEFVDGQTLQEKKSTLTQKQAIDYGIQIAEGLAAAHEKGIVHRDIKPENIMIRKDGIVQVMDFGLAKLVGASRLTKVGSTVGTLGYMSPEQVQGQETTHRSDIFSFGVLLYEMLTGKSPFTGAHESAILYEIVNVDVAPPSALKPELDPELDRIVMECMEKEPNERMQSIKQVAIDLNRFKRTSSRTRMSRTFSTGSMSRGTQQSAAMSPVKIVFNAKNLPWLITSIVVIISIILVILIQFGGGHTATTNRFNISVINTSDQQIARSDIPSIALSPDGSMLAFTMFESGVTQIYVRSLMNFQCVPLKGTANGTAPFFSPDGQWIGFAADGKIKKIPVQGGAVEIVTDAVGFRGASWGTDDRIYFSPTFASGIMSVSSKGGDPKVISTLDTIRHERTHRWVQVLPGCGYVLYTLGDVNNPNSYSDAPIVIQSIESGERHVLDVRGEMARYVEPGYLIVGRNGSLLAAPFSLKDFRLTKQLSTVITEVSSDPGSGVVDYDVSSNGHLVYLPGALNKDLELVWADLEGKVTPISAQLQPYNAPRISPDGKKIAVTFGVVRGSDNDIWIYDIQQSSFSRLTFGKKMFAPAWSADSKTIYYANAVASEEGIWEISADGGSEGKLLQRMTVPTYPVSVSRDGKFLILNTEGGPSDGDIPMIDLQKRSSSTMLLNTPPYESGGQISPDGKYFLFFTNETGTFEIFVRSFPELKGKWQISVNGGVSPKWSPDGKYIYFINPLGKLMEAKVRTQPTFSAEQPRDIFDVTQMYFPNNPVYNYDIAPDGKRFIMVRNGKNNAKMTAFNYIMNWTEELSKN